MHGGDLPAVYTSQFGAAPTLLVRAPGRINLIGEHTDYNDGYVLPAAIDKAIWLAAGPRTDKRLAFYAADLSDMYVSDDLTPVFQTEKTWANYLLGTVSEVQKEGLQLGGLNVAFGGDVPLGAGLSSSAALESGMIRVLNDLFDLKLAPMDIVRLAQRSENRFVGMQCGIMDMFASVMGRADEVVRLDCATLEYAYFPFVQDTYRLLLLDSGVKHQLVDSEYNTRRKECEQGVAILRTFDASVRSLRQVTLEMLDRHRSDLPEKVYQRCRFVVAETNRVQQTCAALQAGDFATVGQLMLDSHDGLDKAYEVCVPETNFLVDFARKRITGSRQMGGGFGGCTLNLLPSGDTDTFITAATEAYQQAFGLELKAYPVHLSNGVERIF